MHAWFFNFFLKKINYCRSYRLNILVNNQIDYFFFLISSNEIVMPIVSNNAPAETHLISTLNHLTHLRHGVQPIIVAG